MNNTSIVIKNSNGKILKFCVNSIYLGRLITNYKLYQKDTTFIEQYIKDYAEYISDCSTPSTDGIIVIDFIEDIILDSQCVTGINKLTPLEIKSSKNGNIPDETTENSIIDRFSVLVKNNYLKGFEEWSDKGYYLNRKIGSMDLSQLLELIMNTSAYGQFVFETKPFKVESYLEHDKEDQQLLFKRLKDLNILNEEDIIQWNNYLNRLK